MCLGALVGRISPSPGSLTLPSPQNDNSADECRCWFQEVNQSIRGVGLHAMMAQCRSLARAEKTWNTSLAI